MQQFLTPPGGMLRQYMAFLELYHYLYVRPRGMSFCSY